MNLKIGDRVRFRTLYSPGEGTIEVIAGEHVEVRLASGHLSMVERDTIMTVLGNELAGRVICIVSEHELALIESVRTALNEALGRREMFAARRDELTIDQITIIGHVENANQTWEISVKTRTRSQVEADIQEIKKKMGARNAVV